MGRSPESLGSDDLQDQLSQNIKLRRELGAEVARVLGNSSNEDRAKVASNSDSLEALRRELRLRRNSKIMIDG
jgi:hypothetical protein